VKGAVSEKKTDVRLRVSGQQWTASSITPRSSRRDTGCGIWRGFCRSGEINPRTARARDHQQNAMQRHNASHFQCPTSGLKTANQSEKRRRNNSPPADLRCGGRPRSASIAARRVLAARIIDSQDVLRAFRPWLRVCKTSLSGFESRRHRQIFQNKLVTVGVVPQLRAALPSLLAAPLGAKSDPIRELARLSERPASSW
jgi:hypothetical protein